MRLRFWQRRNETSRVGANQWRCSGCGRIFTYPERPEYASSEGGRYRAWCSRNCASRIPMDEP